ncbi:MAG TPA: glycosyltransferase family 39 protein [Chloroflexia bacterium]
MPTRPVSRSVNNGKAQPQAETNNIVAVEPSTVWDRVAPLETTGNGARNQAIRQPAEIEQVKVPIHTLPMQSQGKEKKQESPLWRQRSIWLGFLAFLVGVGGEVLLFQEAQRAQGAVLLLLAMLLGLVAWSDTRDTPLLTFPLEQARKAITLRPDLMLRFAGIGVSLGLLWGSFQAFWAQPQEFFGLQGWLWLGSMGILLISCAGWYSPESREALGPRWTTRETAVLAGILVLALAVRLIGLEEIPWQVEGNEYTTFKESMAFYANPPTTSLFTTVFLGTGMPSLWFFPEGLLMRIFGPDLGGARVWPALTGALLVLPTYAMVRLNWGRTAAGIAAFMMAISAVAVHYSRNTLPNIGTALWWGVCFYFLLRGLRTRRPGDFVWAGLAAGTSMYTYYATRLLPYVLVAFLLYMLVFHFRATRERLGHFALLGAGFLAGFGPLLAYMIHNPQMWSGRGESSLLIPLKIPTTGEELAHIWNVLSFEITQNFLSLSAIASRDEFYWAPFMLPLEAVLLLLGVGVLLWRWKQPATFLVLLWAASILGISSIILSPTNPNPNFSHWTPAFPAFYIALALPLALWLRALRHTGRRVWVRTGQAVVAAGLLVSAGANAYFYLVTYPPKVVTNEAIRAVQGRYMERLPSDTLVRFTGCCWGSFDYEYAWMMASHLTVGQLTNPARGLPLVGSPEHNHDFVFTGQLLPYLPVVQEYYPEGELLDLKAPDGSVVYNVWRVKAADAISRHGVKSVFTDANGGQVWEGKLPSAGTLPQGVDLPYPATATWSGVFYVPADGEYTLSVQGGEAEGWVMGQPGALGKPFVLQAGWVPFAIQARLDGPNRLRVLLQAGNGQAIELPTTRLWPQDANVGLAMSSNSAEPNRRVDPFAGSNAMRPHHAHQPGLLAPDVAAQLFQPLYVAQPSPADNLLRWEGEVYTEAGDYGMELMAGGLAQLTVDGTVVAQLCTADPRGQETSGTTTLTEGWHRVQVDLQVMGHGAGTEPRALVWTWTRPDGVREVVPPSRLRYSASPTPAEPVQWPQPPAAITCPAP